MLWDWQSTYFEAEQGNPNGGGFSSPQSDVPADTSDFQGAPAGGGGGGGEDDIPF